MRHAPEPGLVDTDGHDVQPVGLDTHLGDDVLLRVLGHGQVARQAPRDAHLHVEEPVPAPQREPAREPGRGRELEVAVDRDRVVQRVHERPAVVEHAEQPGAEALVVVHDVEVEAALREQLPRAQAERVRLREPGAAHEQVLLQVDEGADLVRPRRAERVLAPVEVEALDLVEGDGVLEHGPGLACEHLDLVPEVGQLCRQVAAVDPLATAVRVAPVDEVGDAERVTGARQGNGGSRHGIRSLPGFPPLGQVGANRSPAGRSPAIPFPLGAWKGQGTSEGATLNAVARSVTHVGHT